MNAVKKDGRQEEDRKEGRKEDRQTGRKDNRVR